MSAIKQQTFFHKRMLIITGVIALSLIVVVEVWYLLGIWRGRLITPQVILSTIHPSPTPTDVPIPTDTPFPTLTPIPPFPTIAMDVAYWKTYQNTAVGISFEYPNNWKTVPYPTDTNVDSATSMSGHGIIQLSPDNPDANVNDAPIQMDYWNNPKRLSLPAYSQQFYNPQFLNDGNIWPDLSSAQIVTIGGKQAYFLAANPK